MQLLDGLKQFKEYAENNLGLTVYAVALKGSQNYNLQDEESDIDANLVFIPSMHDLRTNKTYKIELDIGECICHNIYSFAEITAKGNPQWIEICNTEYIIGDLSIFKHYKINPSALKGMIMEKVNAFKKLYPKRAKYVEKFGYDPKQLHHIIRLYDLLKNDVSIYKYNGADRDYMLDIKRGRKPGSVEEADKLKETYIDLINEIYEERKLSYKPQKIDYELIDKIFIKYLKN